MAFPLVPFINHLPPLATNIQTILRSRGATLLPVYALYMDDLSNARPPYPSVSIPLHDEFTLPPSSFVATSSSSQKEETKPLFIARTWTKNSYYGVAVPREISLSSCGDRIALTKSSKGGVKALSRAQKKKKKGRSKETKSIWTHPPPHPFLPHPFFLVPRRDGMRGEGRALSRFSRRGGAGRGRRRREKGNSIFHG